MNKTMIREYFQSLRRSLPGAIGFIFYILAGNCADEARAKGNQEFRERMKQEHGAFKYDNSEIELASRNAYSAVRTAIDENEAAKDTLGDYSLLVYLGSAIRENLCLGEKPMQKRFNKLVEKWEKPTRDTRKVQNNQLPKADPA